MPEKVIFLELEFAQFRELIQREGYTEIARQNLNFTAPRP